MSPAFCNSSIWADLLNGSLNFASQDGLPGEKWLCRNSRKGMASKILT